MLRGAPIRGASAAAIFAFVLAAFPPAALAYDAILAWRPVEGAVGYRVYRAPDADIGGAPAVNVGTPSPGDDGVIRYVVQDVPLEQASYFAVAAYDADGRESERSNVLMLTRETVAAVLAADGGYERDEITAAGSDLAP